MAKMKLTKASIDRVAKPGLTKSDALYWDTESRGFGLRVTPTGLAKFIVQGRVRGTTQERRETIGTYGAWTLDEARRRAQEIRHQLEDGIDPREQRRQEEAARVTLIDVMEAYLARPGMLKDSTKAEMRRHVEQVFDAWKSKPIASISPADCRKRYEEMATKGLRGKGPAPVQAAIAMVTLRTLVNFAMTEYTRLDGRPIIEHNPVAVLRKDLRPAPPRTRHIDRRNIGKFWHLLMEYRAETLNADAVAAADLVRFLLLTGARRNEGAALTWDRINIDPTDPTNCWWHIPDPKNKNPVWLPLSSQAVAVLNDRPRLTDAKGNEIPWVFSSRAKNGHIMDARAPLKRTSKKIGMDGLSAHDLRRTYVSIGVKACRLDLAKLELLTNHVPQGITARHYLATSDLRDFHAEVQAIGDYIETEGAVAASQTSGSNVVPLHTGAA